MSRPAKTLTDTEIAEYTKVVFDAMAQDSKDQILAEFRKLFAETLRADIKGGKASTAALEYHGLTEANRDWVAGYRAAAKALADQNYDY